MQDRSVRSTDCLELLDEVYVNLGSATDTEGERLDGTASACAEFHR